MSDFFNCLFTHNGIAYGTGVLIFLITLFLVSRRIIGFTLTFLFLLFALLASMAVAHQDAVKAYLNKFSSEKATDGTYRAEGTQPKSGDNINASLQKAFDDLKSEFEVQKEKMQKLWEEYTTQKPQQNQNNPNPPNQGS